MTPINDALNAFGCFSAETYTENFSAYIAMGELSDVCLSGSFKNSFVDFFSRLSEHRITCSLSFIVNEVSVVDFSTETFGDIEGRILLLNEEINNLESDDVVSLSVHIDKEQSRDLHVFDMDLFCSSIGEYTLEQLLMSWSKSRVCGKNKVYVWDALDRFGTDSFHFISIYNHFVDPPTRKEFIELPELIEKRNKCSHFSNASLIELCPDDFVFYYGDAPENIKLIFNALSGVLSLIFLCDFIAIKGNGIDYSLKGYKLISGKINFKSFFSGDFDELRAIFHWVYWGGNVTDKVGIARNVASIHLKNDCILELEDGTANSVRSGYELYLKENIKNYIELKNKVTEFLQSQSDRASHIVGGMFKSLSTGLWTSATFFITVFLLRGLGKSGDGPIFGWPVTFVAFLLVGFSFLYLLISLHEVSEDRDRLFGKFADLKNRYSDIFDKKDLDSIFQFGEIEERERTYINSRKRVYGLAWAAMNIVFIIFVVAMYCNGL